MVQDIHKADDEMVFIKSSEKGRDGRIYFAAKKVTKFLVIKHGDSFSASRRSKNYECHFIKFMMLRIAGGLLFHRLCFSE